MKNNDRYSDREWEELASLLSGEKNEQSELLGRFMADDSTETAKKWKELRTMSDEKEINVDKAWRNVYTKMLEDPGRSRNIPISTGLIRSSFMKIAAIALVILSLGIAGTYFRNPDIFSRKITVATNDNQKNIRVSLPDGSAVSLNRNSVFTYRSNFGRRGRNVMLTGEAFFEITHDASKPFIIDAGKAKIRVVGTSFNVITTNNESAVEVFVKTGKVMLSNDTGSESVAIDPGYIGTMDSGRSGKTINKDLNYLSWNTGLLIYNGQKLDIVFKDLKRVYNLDIEVADPAILENEWTSPIDNQPQETIIRLICASFNLSSTKDGNVYHLVKK